MRCTRITWAIGLCLLAANLTLAGEDAKSAPRVVEIELFLAETTRVAAAEKGPLDLSAPAEKLQASLLELQKQGQLDSVARIHLNVLESQRSSVQISETVPVVAGRTTTGNATSTSVTDRQVGLTVGITASCQADGQISVKLDLSHGRHVAQPPAAREAPKADDLRPPQLMNTALKTTVLIPDGKTIVLSATSAATGGQTSLLVVLATARIQAVAQR